MRFQPKIFLSPLLLALLACFSWACKHEPLSVDLSSKDRLHIVATTGILGNCLDSMLAGRAIVNKLMGPGVDPHLYKASLKDVKMLLEADIIVYHGLHLEGKMAEILEKLAKQKPVINLAEGLPKDKLIQLGEHTYDPHVWMDPQLWAIGLAYVADQLALLDSANANVWEAKAAKYIETIYSVSDQLQHRIDSIPALNRVLVTSHDAFSYYGRAFGLQVKPLQGVSTQSDLGLKEINNLVNYLVNNPVPAIFVETSSSHKSIQAVQEGLKNRGLNIKTGGALFTDALDNPTEPAGNYLGMLRQNTHTITTALTP